MSDFFCARLCTYTYGFFFTLLFEIGENFSSEVLNYRMRHTTDVELLFSFRTLRNRCL